MVDVVNGEPVVAKSAADVSYAEPCSVAVSVEKGNIGLAR